ncbi:T9SS type A sorting domain-containing protein [Flavobacterium subsaxonicum]|uniref:Secretion system C-terminal sorting domain-containing protein n=1 Tax=Flavobacterium subsaxonicum WB 4.1-42 = DSM 21790 TaxID=1121898 RepID=A0A0A2MN33_9FLAO|nr:T9SS type A sorting domain-containing protein [Flavobacterium subsaxonicum]KGO93709.1 hypothetical protein Q766_07050 [Flavobacterium subsaxonicum WB 4.1-42 = DSM 21790]
MKKNYFLALALATGFMANAQFTDDFESYEDGEEIGNAHWTSWSGGVPGENIVASTAEAFSGTKSGYIGNDGQDALLLLGEKSSGTYTLQYNMLIPTADDWAFYGIMDAEDTESEFSINMYANYVTIDDVFTPNQLAWTYSDGTSNYVLETADYIPGEWFTITHVINLDDQMIEIKFNGETVYSGDFHSTAGTLGQVDFWSLENSTTGENNNAYYLDNIQYVEGTELSVNNPVLNNASVVAYPNPAKDVLNIASQDNISEVTMFNVAGQQVLTAKPNTNSAQVKLNNLSAGMYIVKIVSGNQTISKKISVN